MHPILIQIGRFTIYTYGFFVALGMLTALWFILYQSKKWGLPPEDTMDTVFYSVIAGIVGARLFYVFLYFPMFRNNPLEIFKLWNGGLVFYGGFLAGLVCVFACVKIKKLPLDKAMDIIALCVPLAHGIGRIGCFCAGCCYGKPGDLPWAVAFTHPETLARPIGVPLHPTQLYCSLGNFLIFACLLLLSRTGKCSGRLIFVYLVVYGLFRSFVEIFRGDERGAPLVDFLSTSQTIGLAAALFGAACLIYLAVQDRHKKG